MGRYFIMSSWIPLASFVAMSLYVRQYDGWGAWAAAPLLLLPLAVSFGFGLYGLWLCWQAKRSGDLGWRLRLATIFALGPILVVLLGNLFGL
jgi:hypothetical protein